MSNGERGTGKFIKLCRYKSGRFLKVFLRFHLLCPAIANVITLTRSIISEDLVMIMEAAAAGFQHGRLV